MTRNSFPKQKPRPQSEIDDPHVADVEIQKQFAKEITQAVNFCALPEKYGTAPHTTQPQMGGYLGRKIDGDGDLSVQSRTTEGVSAFEAWC